jgi:hypothetical protein
LFSTLGDHGFPVEGKEGVLREILERSARFTAVLRFVLEDEDRRLFRAERYVSQTSAKTWVSVATGPIKRLARRLI